MKNETADNKVGIVKRIDYKPYSSDIYDIIFFCEECDPEGKGRKGGIIGNYKYSDFKEIMPKYHCYCPTCGKKLNWDSIRERTNHLR